MSEEEDAQHWQALTGRSERCSTQASDLAKRIQEAHLALDDARDQSGSIAAQISKSLDSAGNQLANIDWKGVYDRISQSCEKLARLGWTLPLTFTPRELVELVEHANCDDQEIEQFMLDYYTEPEGANFSDLRGSVLHGEALKGWRGLLEQCFEAYERGHFLIAIPALLSVIEGAVAENAGILRTRCTSPKAMVSDLEQSTATGSMTALIWRSTGLVVNALFASSDFRGPHPGQLNRHWVLHGRDHTQWTQKDALRLFNLLATIA